MKNFCSFCTVVLLMLAFGFGCKNNPFSASQYTCNIPGESEPKTSEEFYTRAQKHIEIFSEGGATSLDDCAFGALSEAIRLNPNNIEALRVRGYGYRQRKQYDLALTDLDKAILIEPNNPNNFYFRSKIYFGKSVFEQALIDISEAIRLKPEDHLYYSERSTIYGKLGKNDLAKADADRAFNLQYPNAKQNPPNSPTNSDEILNGKATNLVQPTYPPAARAVRAEGEVKVQVMIDVNGKIVSAKAISGHALLRSAAEAAAQHARFQPTILEGKPVNVKGVIVYNFTP